jgi:hypothetical protein
VRALARQDPERSANEDHRASVIIKEGFSEEQPNVVVDDNPSRLVHPVVRQGSFPGDEHIAFVRPAQPAFRRLGLWSA